MLTPAEERFLETRDRILARRNPELLAREQAEFAAMSDKELAALAARPETRIEPEPVEPECTGFVQATFLHVVRCNLEIVAGCSRMPGGLSAVDLDALAAWQVFGELLEARTG